MHVFLAGSKSVWIRIIILSKGRILIRILSNWSDPDPSITMRGEKNVLLSLKVDLNYNHVQVVEKTDLKGVANLKKKLLKILSSLFHLSEWKNPHLDLEAHFIGYNPEPLKNKILDSGPHFLQDKNQPYSV